MKSQKLLPITADVSDRKITEKLLSEMVISIRLYQLPLFDPFLYISTIISKLPSLLGPPLFSSLLCFHLLPHIRVGIARRLNSMTQREPRCHLRQRTPFLSLFLPIHVRPSQLWLVYYHQISQDVKHIQ